MVKCVRNGEDTYHWEKKPAEEGGDPCIHFEIFHICYQTVGPCKYSCCSLHANHRPGVVLSISCVLAQPNTDTFYGQENESLIQDYTFHKRLLSPNSLASEFVLITNTPNCLLTWMHLFLLIFTQQCLSWPTSVPSLMMKNIPCRWHTIAYQAFYYRAFSMVSIFLASVNAAAKTFLLFLISRCF